MTTSAASWHRPAAPRLRPQVRRRGVLHRRARRGPLAQPPYAIKALGDLIYTGGVNRFIFHRYAQQPWLDLKPGMTMGPFGFEFERTVTWWEQGAAWLQYVARCQYLLQEGRFSADLCYLDGENAPSIPRNEPTCARSRLSATTTTIATLQPSSPAVSVKDGHIVLPDGMNYRVLILPRPTP